MELMIDTEEQLPIVTYTRNQPPGSAVDSRAIVNMWPNGHMPKHSTAILTRLANPREVICPPVRVDVLRRPGCNGGV
jgi:hypothetical protein